MARLPSPHGAGAALLLVLVAVAGCREGSDTIGRPAGADAGAGAVTDLRFPLGALATFDVGFGAVPDTGSRSDRDPGLDQDAVDVQGTADAPPGEDADSGPGKLRPDDPLAGFLQFRVAHNLQDQSCLPADCYLRLEEEQAPAEWLQEIAQHSNLAVLHWDRRIPYDTFSEELPEGADTVAFYEARMEPGLRSWIGAFADHFEALEWGYVAVSILSGGRNTYQPLHTGTPEGAPIAGDCPDFAPGTTLTVDVPERGTLSFEPGTAYERFLLYLHARLRPDYMALLVEANLFRGLCPEQWPGLVKLYHRLYDTLREAAGPELPLFATVAYQWLLDYDEKSCFQLAFKPCDEEAEVDYPAPDPERCFPVDRTVLDDLDEGGRLDILALSFYPDGLLMAPPGVEAPFLEINPDDWDGGSGCWMRTPYGPFADPMEQIERLGWEKPVAMAEWSARSCTTLAYAESEGQTFWALPGANLGSERFWLTHVADYAREHDFHFVVWSFLRDYDPLPRWLVDVEALDRGTLSLLNTWACSGLLDTAGEAKSDLVDTWMELVEGR